MTEVSEAVRSTGLVDTELAADGRTQRPELDGAGIDMTLLHHSAANPLSTPVLAPVELPSAVDVVAGSSVLRPALTPLAP
jgi:hypothetical protein